MPTRTVTKSKKALLDAIELIDEQDYATAAEVADDKDYSDETARAALKFLEMRMLVRRETPRGEVFYKRTENWFNTP